MAAKKKLPPKLDPIFPLPADTGIPPVNQGEGPSIMESTDPRVVVLPYRAFYFMWEHAERQAAKEYPKYVGGPMDHAAQTWLDAVHAFRNAAAGQDLKRYSESKAQKARQIRDRMMKKAAEKARAAKASAKGENNAPEGAITASTAPSEPRKRAGASSPTGKPRSKASKGSKAASKRKPSKRKASK